MGKDDEVNGEGGRGVPRPHTFSSVLHHTIHTG